ncbi:hipA-like C-terminal domain protein [Mycobacterium xenopi 4042]|uniref:HipA-like C-terminal domain protein n=1 Tax=Mycobacterium xenopi 4042 TaxID=1299334 RepID=X7Z5F2_MYCXE|nr:hipA-like C-terminal domain protein [Mycobacterium xenopi 4042]
MHANLPTSIRLPNTASKAETAIGTLSEACARGGGSWAGPALELLKTLVFSWIIGNGDLHGKNLSIYNPDGVWPPSSVVVVGLEGSYHHQSARSPVGRVRWDGGRGTFGWAGERCSAERSPVAVGDDEIIGGSGDGDLAAMV